MSEGKAIVLYLIGMCLLGAVTGVVTMLTQPSGEVFAVTVVLVAALGGFIASEVVMRTSPPESKHD